MKFFSGQINVSTLIPIAIGLLYAGTGGWTDARWTAALAIMGLGPAVKLGYDRGYWTENPELTKTIRSRAIANMADMPRDEHGRFAKKTRDEEVS